ncbi:helicase-associated domain-containing protein, partial [Angustibacter aerolatus]
RPSAAPRSLADDLRARDDVQLVALLRQRPDLATPVPSDVTSLAARAATRASVGRALDGLDAFALQVVDALAVLPEPATRTQVARLLGVKPAASGAVVDELRELALVWGSPSQLRLVRTVRDALGPYPAGLGPPLADLLVRRDPSRLAVLARDLDLTPTADAADLAGQLAAPETLDRLLAGAPEGARTVLDRLAWGPPVGSTPRADPDVDGGSARTPVEWLLAHGLLAVADPGHVVLPREVGLHLRGGHVHERPLPEPPELDLRDRGERAVDAASGASAAELVRLIGELGEAWGVQPPPVLRSGGLGVRELRRTAQTLDVDDATAAVLVEVAYAAGLVADDGQVGPSWAPTPAYDEWSDLPPHERWAVLVGGWARSSRAPGLVGSKDERGTVRSALSPDVERPAARDLRLSVLAELGTVSVGLAPEPASLLARRRRRRPRRAGASFEPMARWALHEAELLGATGRVALGAPGRALVEGRDPAEAMATLLPEPVDHVLLQADLTAVAPGPLETQLARLMALSADVESRGGATVYRFSAGSVRRAMDAGWSAARLTGELSRSSRTPLPQPLEYLVQDVARRHGQVRVSPATSVVRSDDEAALRELLADRRAASLRLRLLAPTVLAAQADPATVLKVLRDLGLAPAAESPDGDLVVRRPDARRTPPRRPP